MRFLEKKTFPFKIFKSSSNKYVTNHMVFSLEKKNAKNESRKERKENSNEFMQKSEAEQKNVPLLWFIERHLNISYRWVCIETTPNPKCDLYFSSLCVETHLIHTHQKRVSAMFYFLLFGRGFTAFFCFRFVLLCDAMVRFRFISRPPPTPSIRFHLI